MTELTRRRLLTAGTATAMASVAGCTGISSDEPTEFTADLAAIPDQDLQATDYQKQPVEKRTLDRTFEIAGSEQQVIANYWVSTYIKPRTPDSPSSTFAAISSPGAEVLGKNRNPLAQLSNEELISQFVGRLDRLNDVEQQETYTTSVFGEERTVIVSTATAEIVEGQESDFHVELASFMHEGDYLVLAGGHPAGTDADVDYTNLMRIVEHPVDPPEDAQTDSDGSDADTAE